MSDTGKTSHDEGLRPAELRLNRYARLAAVLIIALGCYLVLYPFVPAVLFAAVVCSATWPLYLRLRKALWGRPALAALVMTLLLIVLVIGPTVLLAASLADEVTAMAEAAKAMLNAGPIKPPAWVRKIPLAGELLADQWQRLASGNDSLSALWKSLLEPVRNFLIGAGKAAGEGLLQLTLASFIGFFFYRDGEALMIAVRKALDRIAAGRGDEFLQTIDNSVTGAVVGVFGTALAQALVALAGFVIAGVPAAFLLSVATFFLSIVPVGPPLVWGSAAAWLAYDGQMAWAAFMVAWGFFGISTIDNLVKPYLISRSSKLPMLLVVLGVFGGVVAFGFIGLFIGPPVLAIGLTLIQLWIAGRHQPAAMPVGTAPV
ncbi:MAG: AI-2E family transporter [Rhodocyclales bacterium]|nr:AI-2E family transporter [Rhodocyclales bacterium]